MQVISQPLDYQGANTEPTFVLTEVEPDAQTQVEVWCDAQKLGTKRFTGLNTLRINVAGYAFRKIDIAPPAATLGIVPLRASAAMRIVCGQTASQSVPITLAVRRELPKGQPLSSAPQVQAVPRCALVCVPFIAEEAPEAMLTLLGVDVQKEVAMPVEWQGEGIYAAVVDFGEVLTAQMADAELFYGAKLVAAGVEYTFTFTGDNGVTLLWLNDFGVLEACTFTVPITSACPAERNLSVVKSRRKMTLATPLMPAAHLEWIGGIERSPKVWLREGADWREVEVEKWEAEIRPDVCSSARVTIITDTITARSL